MSMLLGRLVRLFPPAFRHQFGNDLREQVRTDLRRARASGRWRELHCGVATAFDLIRSAFAERLHPTWTPAPRPSIPEPRRDLTTMLSHWTNDLRLAFRSLRRSPGFAAIAVVTLALAIGANVGIFAVIDSVLLNPLPYAEPHRLVDIAASAPGSDFPPEFGVSEEFVIHYGERSQLIESLAGYDTFTNTLRVDDRVERIRQAFVTQELWATLGVPPLHGRLPGTDDPEGTVVISHQLWTTWFGSDRSVLGSTVDLFGQSREIVAVMGPDFWFPGDGTLLWISYRPDPAAVTPGRFGTSLVARLAPGADEESLARELEALARELPERFGGSAAYAELMQRHRPVIVSQAQEVLGDIAGPLWLMLGAVALVLAIACANVSNLFLVRAEHRQLDLAVRRALGAGRGALLRTLLAEALVVAAAAGLMAVVVAWLSVPVFLQVAPSNVPRLDEVTIGLSTLGFAAALSFAAALVCGLFPAWRSSSARLTRLRESGGRGTTRGRAWSRDALVVLQTALALVLLIGSGLLVRSFQELRAVDPGYDTDNVFTFQMAPEGEHLRDARSYARFHLDFAARLAALPGVDSAGLVENVPLNEGLRLVPFRTEDMPAPGPDEVAPGPRLNYTWVGGDYFRTMGIELQAGRPLHASDPEADSGSVVVSRAAADALWPGESALGRRLQRSGSEAWYTVVGVVEDVMQYTFRGEPDPLVYFSLVELGEEPPALSSPGYVVRTTRAEEIAPEVRALVRQVAPEAPMYRTFTMAELASDSMIELSFTMLTLATVTGLALLLGAIGLFGVLSYVVAERTREIGVRMALGAQARRVRSMVVGQGARLVGVGVAIGLVVALLATRGLDALLFGVGSSDPVTYGATALAMVAIGVLASYLPARRASRVDPIESLRDA